MSGATKESLKVWIVDAVHANGGSAKLIDVAKHIWRNHNEDLEAAGDLFFRWQYDMRWAANVLRHEGVLLPIEDTPRGVWALVKR